MPSVNVFLILQYSENKFPFEMKATFVSYDSMREELAYDFIFNFIKLDLKEQIHFIDMRI